MAGVPISSDAWARVRATMIQDLRSHVVYVPTSSEDLVGTWLTLRGTRLSAPVPASLSVEAKDVLRSLLKDDSSPSNQFFAAQYVIDRGL